MDDSGNILIKHIAKSNVYVKNTTEENSIANEILKLPNGALEPEKPVKLFDMKKFQQNVNRELKRSRPDRKRLECQCVSSVAFVKNEPELLDSPIWIMLINVVALEMLKAKMPNPGEVRNGGAVPMDRRHEGESLVVLQELRIIFGCDGAKRNLSGERSEEEEKLTSRGESDYRNNFSVWPDFLSRQNFRQNWLFPKGSVRDTLIMCPWL